MASTALRTRSEMQAREGRKLEEKFHSNILVTKLHLITRKAFPYSFCCQLHFIYIKTVQMASTAMGFAEQQPLNVLSTNSRQGSTALPTRAKGLGRWQFLNIPINIKGNNTQGMESVMESDWNVQFVKVRVTQQLEKSTQGCQEVTEGCRMQHN